MLYLLQCNFGHHHYFHLDTGHSEEGEEEIISSLVINVGSGKGTTLADIATIMEDFIPPNDVVMEPTQDTVLNPLSQV